MENYKPTTTAELYATVYALKESYELINTTIDPDKWLKIVIEGDGTDFKIQFHFVIVDIIQAFNTHPDDVLEPEYETLTIKYNVNDNYNLLVNEILDTLYSVDCATLTRRL